MGALSGPTHEWSRERPLRFQERINVKQRLVSPILQPMKGEELGAVSVAHQLFEDGLRDDEVIAELRTQCALDEYVAAVVVRHARTMSRRAVKASGERASR